MGVASLVWLLVTVGFHSQFTSSRIMTLAKETEKEKDAPKSREAVYLLLDLVSVRNRALGQSGM